MVIKEDKRTIWYLSACAALFAASAYFVATRLDDALLRIKTSIGSIGCFVIMAAAIVAIYLIVLSRMILIIKFTGSGIKYGFWAKREILYSEICGVATKDGLEIHLQKETRRIRVIGLSQNEEEYVRLLKTIDDNTEVDAQPQNHISRLKKTAYIPEQRKWLRDTLLFLFIYLLMTLFDNVIFIFMVVSMDFAQMIFPAELILHNILLIWGLTAAVFMAGKHKWAPFLIKTYFWAYFAVAVASYVFAHFRPYMGEPEKISLAEYIIRSVMLVFFALFASRYVTKSETAQSVLGENALLLSISSGSKRLRYRIKSKGLILFTLACLALGAFMTWVANINIPYYYRLDKERYSSPQNVIEQK